jgi:tRNA(fMet)-specific endonuclease VapC
MTRYLLDTNMVSAFIHRRQGVDGEVRNAMARGAIIGTCMPVLAELFYGVELGSRPQVCENLR